MFAIYGFHIYNPVYVLIFHLFLDALTLNRSASWRGTSRKTFSSLLAGKLRLQREGDEGETQRSVIHRGQPQAVLQIRNKRATKGSEDAY
jgi:hypothetical protein